MKLEQVTAADLTAEEMSLLRTITDLTKFGYQPADIIEHQIKGWKQFWRVPNGLLVTYTEQHPGGKELHMWGMAGKGLFANDLEGGIREAAKNLKCRWVTAGSAGPLQERLYRQKFKIKPVGAYFIEEV